MITSMQCVACDIWELANEIHKFWQTLNCNVQSLETLGKLSGRLCMLRGVLDKLNWKPGWQVKESVHMITPHYGDLPSSASTTVASSLHSSQKQFLCARSGISLTTRLCLLRSRD